MKRLYYETEAVVRCFAKFAGNTCDGASCFSSIVAIRLWLYLKKNTNEGVILQNFSDHFFNPSSANPQNGQTHSNNLSVTADELIECVWQFCEVGA